MEEFVLFRQRKAAMTRFEAARSWEQQGSVVPKERSSASCAESAASSPGSGAVPPSEGGCSKYADKDLLKFMETRS